MMAAGATLWRIAKHTPLYRADDLSGEGAKLTGGRWNSRANAVVYTASSIALAALESLAHLGNDTVARNRFLVQVSVPPEVWKLRQACRQKDLDPTWLAEPPGSGSIALGDAWLKECAAPLLLVPSIIVPEEHNVLINPAHPATGKIKARVLRQFVYDPRLC